MSELQKFLEAHNSQLLKFTDPLAKLCYDTNINVINILKVQPVYNLDSIIVKIDGKDIVFSNTTSTNTTSTNTTSTNTTSTNTTIESNLSVSKRPFKQHEYTLYNESVSEDLCQEQLYTIPYKPTNPQIVVDYQQKNIMISISEILTNIGLIVHPNIINDDFTKLSAFDKLKFIFTNYAELPNNNPEMVINQKEFNATTFYEFYVSIMKPSNLAIYISKHFNKGA
jgi:hypothetical protein